MEQSQNSTESIHFVNTYASKLPGIEAGEPSPPRRSGKRVVKSVKRLREPKRSVKSLSFVRFALSGYARATELHREALREAGFPLSA